MRELLVKIAEALYVFDDSSILLNEIDDYLAELAKPEPKPSAWLNRRKNAVYLNNYHDDDEPLYTTTPAQQKPEPVAIVGDTYNLLWYGRRHYSGIKVGDLLYTNPPSNEINP